MSLSLSNVLCAPTMTKNLISVSRLCQTNNVYVTFFPSNFQVKDLRTGAILLQEPLKDGVYVWPVMYSSSAPPLAFLL